MHYFISTDYEVNSSIFYINMYHSRRIRSLYFHPDFFSYHSPLSFASLINIKFSRDTAFRNSYFSSGVCGYFLVVVSLLSLYPYINIYQARSSRINICFLTLVSFNFLKRKTIYFVCFEDILGNLYLAKIFWKEKQ